MSNRFAVFFIIIFISLLSAQSNYELLLSRPDITGLTGGGIADLDGIPTTGLAVGTIIIVYDGSETRIYRLTAGTDAENSPTVIRPDDFADPGNAKVWKARLSSDPTETGFAGGSANDVDITLTDTTDFNFINNATEVHAAFVDHDGMISILNAFVYENMDDIAANADSIDSLKSRVGGMDGHSLDAADGNPVDAVYVDDNGNVGIGTTTNIEALDVVTCAATGSVDQQQLTSTSGWGPNSGWQSFTAGVTGALTHITIQRAGLAGPVGITIRIREGEGTLGAILSTTVITLGNGWFDVDINDCWIFSGQQYTIHITSGACVCWRFANGTNPYPGGRASITPTDDFVFKTWVAPKDERSFVVKNFGGKVGIGTVSPSNRLSVNGNVDFTGTLGVGTTTPQNALDVEGSAAIGASYSGTSAAPTNGLIVEGNVGIGTSSTSDPLQIGEASDAGEQLDIEQSTAIDIFYGTNQWQSFKPTISGDLTAFSVKKYGPTTAPGNLYIYEGTGTGGTLLHTQADTISGASSSWVRLDMNSAVTVTAGQTYTFRFVTAVNCTILGNPNFGGDLYVDGYYWSNVSGSPAGWDMVFRVYIDPLPTGTFIVQSGGDVGIGTMLPRSRLELKGETSDNTTSALNVTNAAGVSAFYVQNNLGVGIGTTNPNYKFEVKGDAGDSGPNMIIDEYGRLKLYRGGDFSSSSDIPDASGVIYIDGGAYESWNIYITDSDNLTFDPGVPRGGNYAYINDVCGVMSITSDRRLKKNIENYGSVLDDVMRLQAIKYNGIDSPDGTPKAIGFIAQEVLPFFPELVSEDCGNLGLTYSHFSVIAIEAIKEVNSKLEVENRELRAKNAELEKRIEALEKK